jgi:hypothetical protein
MAFLVYFVDSGNWVRTDAVFWTGYTLIGPFAMTEDMATSSTRLAATNHFILRLLPWLDARGLRHAWAEMPPSMRAAFLVQWANLFAADVSARFFYYRQAEEILLADGRRPCWA